jgi:hypothetical protein
MPVAYNYNLLMFKVSKRVKLPGGPILSVKTSQKSTRWKKYALRSTRFLHVFLRNASSPMFVVLKNQRDPPVRPKRNSLTGFWGQGNSWPF